jgi:copper-binding protein NosD
MAQPSARPVRVGSRERKRRSRSLLALRAARPGERRPDLAFQSVPRMNFRPLASRRLRHAMQSAYLVLLLVLAGWSDSATTASAAAKQPLAAPRVAATPSSRTTTRDVFVGGSIVLAVGASVGGDVVVVHGGSYGQVVLSKVFVTPVRVVAAAGEVVSVAGFVVSGGAGYLFSGFRTSAESRLENAAHDVGFDRLSCVIPSSDTTSSCLYVHDASFNVSVTNSRLVGGVDGVKFYGCSGSSWAHNVRVADSEVSGASEDLIHVNCASNVTVEHNWLHDPVDNADHNDGVQSQASDNLQILRNTFTFQSVPASGGPNQAIMLGNVPAQWPDRKVTNTLVANNLVAHWNGGRPLIMNGTENLTIVNNTFMDSGSGARDPGITISWQDDGQNGRVQNVGLALWNNITNTIYIDPGADPPSFSDSNLLTLRHAPPGIGRVITVAPRFVDRTTYALAKSSRARHFGIVRERTPRVDIDRRVRSTPPGVGARA